MGVLGPREGFDFLCALSHTQPRVLLQAVSRPVSWYFTHTFALSFQVPLSIYFTVEFVLHFTICILQLHSHCLHSISRAFRYMLFRPFLLAQPRASPLGFLMGSLLCSLCIHCGSHHVFSRSLHCAFPVSS